MKVETCFLLMAAALISLFIAGNIAWQRWYCGSPLSQCRAFATIPCEPILGLEAQRSEYVRLAAGNNYRGAEAKNIKEIK